MKGIKFSALARKMGWVSKMGVNTCVADPEGVSVSVRSSSNWEAVTTLDATFLGVTLAARAARDRVEMPRGTYSGSCSSSEPMNRRADGATNFHRPRA